MAITSFSWEKSISVLWTDLFTSPGFIVLILCFVMGGAYLDYVAIGSNPFWSYVYVCALEVGLFVGGFVFCKCISRGEKRNER